MHLNDGSAVLAHETTKGEEGNKFKVLLGPLPRLVAELLSRILFVQLDWEIGAA